MMLYSIFHTTDKLKLLKPPQTLPGYNLAAVMLLGQDEVIRSRIGLRLKVDSSIKIHTVKQKLYCLSGSSPSTFLLTFLLK